MQETLKGRAKQIHQSTYFSIAEKTAHVPFLDHQILECDCNGREYTNVDHDITLRIPEGAVAEGEKVHFEIAVVMYGPFNFPAKTKLVSPILWLCLLEEAVKLRKSLQIILPHYLTGNIHQYSVTFVKANHRAYEMNDNSRMFYNFRPLVNVSDTVLICREGQGYGITVTDHFCYLCLVAQENVAQMTANTNYCLARVESHGTESLQEIIFCASYLLPTCIKVQLLLLEHYTASYNMQALKQQYLPSTVIEFSRPFKFKESQGSLKIIIERSSDKYLIAVEPSDAEVIFITCMIYIELQYLINFID